MNKTTGTIKRYHRAIMLFAAITLGGCQATGADVLPILPASEVTATEPEMTRTRAAEICWMNTEKGHSSINLERRADLVNKCIDEKMKGAL
jgi:hypothetical protein